MPRIKPLNPQPASGPAKDLLDRARAALGGTPNMIATMAKAPPVLDGYLSLAGALARGSFSAGLREQIALAVAGVNGCDYCASAHTAIGLGAGVEKAELARALEGEPSEPKARAAVRFARAVVEKRGWVGDADLAAAREGGLSEGEVLEVVGAVALNIFTNYFNHVAQTEVDFPIVRTPQPAGA